MQLLGKTSFTVLLGIFVATIPMSAGPIYSNYLSGANEVPPTGSTATGFANAIVAPNDALYVDFMFSGLSSPARMLSIHCCGSAGVNAPVALPFFSFTGSRTSGDELGVIDLAAAASYSPEFLTANGGTAALAEAAFLAGLDAGQAYANITSTNFPGGEIRGQLLNLPEPATGLLIGSILTALALILRRRLRSD